MVYAAFVKQEPLVTFPGPTLAENQPKTKIYISASLSESHSLTLQPYLTPIAQGDKTVPVPLVPLILPSSRPEDASIARTPWHLERRVSGQTLTVLCPRQAPEAPGTDPLRKIVQVAQQISPDDR